MRYNSPMPTHSASFRERYGPWALVTGAAQGLGAEFARQLAARGLNLLLVDVLEEALRQRARQTAADSGVETRALRLDLTRPDMLAALRRATAALDIGLLVNNAGVSAIGPFLDVPAEQHARVLEVNARAPMLLAHHFGGLMRARGRGGIIFVSSGSAVVGTSFVSAYSASKAFVRNLGEALWAELHPRGVDVLAVLVGATNTPGWRAGTPNPDASVWPPVMRAEDTVREALNALGKGPVCTPGVQNRLAFFFTSRLLSRSAAVRMMHREMRKRYGD